MIKMLSLILVIQIIYVSAFTVRMILTLKGQKYIAAVISVAEIMIYVLGLNLVLSYLNQTIYLIVYALGYAFGILIGSWIEEKIALGYVTLKVISIAPEARLPEQLRENGFGVTSWIGSGRDGNRLVMEILAKRKHQDKVYDLVLKLDPKAFVITVEPKRFHGGFWAKAIKRG
ncbi:DUF2179 domain-containing protein [Paenibacillus glycanilyticus]|uniref:UPF0316 protein MU1_09870 n=1 Tax=Paenibacillus glycanilyticus TaxID=126569 RepID=A0ABQ6G6P1_9BACL|nr:DUF2179 domain-containing protein [Paenibacillus glycanilyticus]GLX66643.1 UPF0316 protein YebE [Paenibacillus glycanilyticus]